MTIDGLAARQVRPGWRGCTGLLVMALALGNEPVAASVGQREGAASAQPAATVRGTVVDGATGRPLVRVQVTELAVDGGATGASTETTAEGRFELPLGAGPRRLRFSVVGYAIVVRDVTVEDGRQAELTVALAGGTGAYEETVTVTAGRFRTADPGTPSQQVLGGVELQNLRGVLADDPLRAVQVLPGVSSADDLRSEFSVRGSSFSRMHFTIDGFTTPYLLHSVRAVEDGSSSGSVAMINSDILEDVALLSGGYAQRMGNRTGAAVEFHLRPGSRERAQLRGSVSGTGASVVGEGPLGRGRRGSWIVSARQSYLDLLIDRLVDDQVEFGFSDAQAKIVYDVTSRQRAELTVIAGRSRLREPEVDLDPRRLYEGRNTSTIGIARWQRSAAQSVVSAGLLVGVNRFGNDTIDAIALDRGREAQVSARLDARRTVSSSIELEGGVEAFFTDERRERRRAISLTDFLQVNDYAARGTRSGAHLMGKWSLGNAVDLRPGVRVDHWSLTGDTTVSPWLQGEWRVARGTTLRLATGIYHQFPDIEASVGEWGSPQVGPERAVHVDVGLQRMVGTTMRLQATVYDREERDFVRRPEGEIRLEAGWLVYGSPFAKYETRLDGHARGVELLVQRLESNGFSGWASYAYGRNRYADRVSGESFWGDLDQRHTINLYAHHRLSPRTSVSGKLRVGSNFPVPGYYRSADGRVYVGARRNDVRMPSYTRLDVRANRTFSWSARRLTLFAEVINVLNRDNVRSRPPSIDGRTYEARRLYESMIPIVPSVGLQIEF